MGTVVDPYGTVVHGTGYAYTPWVGSVWYPPPYTYGMGGGARLQPGAGLHLRISPVGLRHRCVGHAVLRGGVPPRMPCCGSASASVYGNYRNTAFSGTEHRLHECEGARSACASSGSWLQQSHRHVGQLRHQQELQPLHRSWLIAVARLPAATPGRRLVRRGRQPQLQHLHGPEIVGFQLLGHRRWRQLGRPHAGANTAGPQGFGHTGTDDGEQRSRPIEDHQLWWQRPLRRRERQRLQRQFRRWLAAALVQRLERRRRYVWAMANHRRAAPAAISFSGFSGFSGSRFGVRWRRRVRRKVRWWRRVRRWQARGGGGFSSLKAQRIAANDSQANPTTIRALTC